MLDFLFTKTPLAYLTMSLWRDEAFSYLLASKPFFQIPFLTSQDFSPPLYYLLLNIWMKIFGSSEIAMRSLSLIFFVLTVYFAFDFMLDFLHIKGRRRWLYFSFLLASPFLGYFAFEARMYSMLAFFATASWYFLLKHKWKTYIALIVLGLHTHYFMGLAFISQLAYAAILPHTSLIRKRLLKNAIFVGGFCIPWALFVLINKPPVQTQFWITSPESKDLVAIPVMLLTGIEQQVKGTVNTVIVFMSSLLWIYTAFMSRRLFKKAHDKEVFLALFMWTALPLVLILVGTLFKPLYLPRYIIFTSVGFMLMLFMFLEHSKEKPRIALTIILGVFLLFYQGYQLKHHTKDDIRSVVRNIKSFIGPKDVIYVDNELNFHTAQYYFDPTRVFIISKTYQEIPTYVGKILIPNDKIRLSPPPFPQRAFIISSDLRYEIQSSQ